MNGAGVVSLDWYWIKWDELPSKWDTINVWEWKRDEEEVKEDDGEYVDEENRRNGSSMRNKVNKEGTKRWCEMEDGRRNRINQGKEASSRSISWY
jgi:hypothetical protein